MADRAERADRADMGKTTRNRKHHDEITSDDDFVQPYETNLETFHNTLSNNGVTHAMKNLKG